MKHIVFNALLISAVAVGTAMSAHAAVTYNLTGSGFTAPTSGAFITSTGGDFELVYSLVGSSPETETTFPSNITYGTLSLVCVQNCASSPSDSFGAFTIVIDVNDTTDSANGSFTGKSSGGSVTNNSSTVLINWQSPTSVPLGSHTFTVFSPTPIVPLTQNGGVSTIFGTVDESISASTPEPSTLALMGIGLLGLGWRRAAKS
jgi:hypothetical protein